MTSTEAWGYAAVFAWAVASFVWAGPVWRLLVRRWTWRQQVAQVIAEAEILTRGAAADVPMPETDMEAAAYDEVMRWYAEGDEEDDAGAGCGAHPNG